ncbi:type II secretion system protein [Sporosarcina pasteurii]|uniref:Tfp pilus assembly protein PilE n=1 Tax=Sporosarcina pasteurii TaxID=1474 RepID=A0A380BVM8_SPOPA|nr:type II secretion system protein [Sporosarcina pasteurii]MDS9471346.1 type II secretion system protein [Sporosarcina pasteurii]QBQ05026.1 type II secretion system protein [Sporosarcina pasteurii]SUJ07894.1 Tfp pilus assembly protein PilE [Sporosarcina pasteurii]
MKNEKGLTLIELLAVLAIIGLITTLIGSVLINGLKASDRSSTNQRLQQEANYITEMIRNEYLKLEDDSIEFIIDNENQYLKMDGDIISKGFTYCYNNHCSNEHVFMINRNENQQFKLELKIENLSYNIETTFSKLR